MKATEYVSMDIVEFLRKRGMTLRQIGELVGHGESYISRVARGERSFTIEHLMKLEKKLGTPLPVLLLTSIDKKQVDRQLQPLYQHLRKLLGKSGKASSPSRQTKRRKTRRAS